MCRERMDQTEVRRPSLPSPLSLLSDITSRFSSELLFFCDSLLSKHTGSKDKADLSFSLVFPSLPPCSRHAVRFQTLFLPRFPPSSPSAHPSPSAPSSPPPFDPTTVEQPLHLDHLSSPNTFSSDQHQKSTSLQLSIPTRSRRRDVQREPSGSSRATLDTGTLSRELELLIIS